MEQKDKPVMVLNGNIINNGGTINGDIVNPIYYSGQKDSMTNVSMDTIRGCMKQLAETDVIVDGKQWWAIYKVLCQDCGFPKNISSFCTYVKKLELDKGFAHQCEYENFRKVGTECPHLPLNVDLWDPSVDNLSDKEKKLATTAQSLRNMLGLA